ncbi:pentapeptide repeat-containing protein [Haloplanus aerogenes]|uniref:Pentapeptide repeat-containing protein n=1 Tax=Haloplanus aerogenes TaxID=660522 RepID=A0A3M0CVZ8_9EURY|nr:pentapeptide repeat-containing protein [Haloplanus aerogenes]AZH27052.1 pentapeptide repeat-containing protein [Haloplanus aerogenes]RMB13452.1 uncharacterized protein YjbI with pentapeptide repeats [Haloplanus aerogenes]
MSGGEDTCGYVLDPDDPETWGGEEGEECRIDEELLNERGVWTCPHGAEAGEKLCIFHQRVEDKENGDVVEALSNAVEAVGGSDAESESDRTNEFIGAKFERVEIEAGTVIEAQIRFDHASIREGFLAEEVDFERGMSAKGARVGTEHPNDHTPTATDHGGWAPLEASIGRDHHGSFPSTHSPRHVSFCGAEFSGDVLFESTKFEGTRHVSFAHADFGGDGDVSFAETTFENEGHVAFNKADFENHGEVSFEGAVFEHRDASFSVIDFENGGDVSFEEVAFRDGGNVAFHDTDFVNDAGVSFTDVTVEDVRTLDFRGATFTEDVTIDITADNVETISYFDADFSRATLNVESIPEVSFESANLTGVDLSEVDLSGANLERAQLTGADLFGTDLSGTRIYGARIGDAAINTETEFDEHGEDRCIYDPDSKYEYDRDPDEEVGQIRKAMGAYHVLEQLTRANTLPDKQARFFARRQDMRREQLRRDGRRLDYWFAKVQNMIFRHGESFSRVVGWSVGTIVVFAFIFPLGGWLQSDSTGALTYRAIADSPVLLWKSFYHSALLFLTGNGSLAPTGFVGEVLTTIEAMIAPILLALLVFVLGRRAAR